MDQIQARIQDFDQEDSSTERKSTKKKPEEILLTRSKAPGFDAPIAGNEFLRTLEGETKAFIADVKGFALRSILN